MSIFCWRRQQPVRYLVSSDVGSRSAIELVASKATRAPFGKGAFDRALRTGEDLRQAALYILNNPVRKGLVEDFRLYPLCGSLQWEI